MQELRDERISSVNEGVEGESSSPFRFRIRFGFGFGVATTLTALGASEMKLAARDMTGDKGSGVGSRGRWTMGTRGGTAAIWL